MGTVVRRNDLMYPELSYRVVGILFDVFSALGYKYKEIHYQRAIELLLKKLNINFIAQAPFVITFENEVIGRYYFDFLIEEKLILEIKRGDKFSRDDIQQVVNYLKAKNLKLGILARFSSKGLKTKRILNIFNS